MQKNVASQKWIVFAFDETDNTPKTGDATQITAKISKDGAAGGSNITDTNPTELEDGYYVFDIAQGESNADLLVIMPESSTGNIQVIGVPGAVWTTEPNRNKLSVDSNGRIDVIKVAGTTQTANDGQADINTILSRVTGNVALASVVGALANAAAAGEVTEVDTLMQYLKQLINILIGAPGIVAFPAEAGPGNGVSLAEVIRAIHADVTGLNGDTMAGVPESVSGTIVDVSSGVYDLTATSGTLSGVDDTYNNMIICFFDNSGSVYETKRITDYDGTGVTRVTVDADLSFPPEDGVDTFVIYRAAYAPVGAASITEGNMNTIRDKVWDATDADFMAQGSKGMRMHHAGKGRY